MNVTGQSVSTPRSKTITGILGQAPVTAGVSVAVVLGETISASQSWPTSSAMSEICLSSLPSASRAVNLLISLCRATSACMVFQPTCRHGLLIAALEKQRWYGPSFLYLAVSIISGAMACSHGLSAGPSAVWPRMASSASKSAWTKNFDCSPVPDDAAAAGADVEAPGAALVVAGMSLAHPAASNIAE